jgi:pimeloyl-ACP methyl ester carboxylesterase
VLTPPDLAAKYFADGQAPVKEMALIRGAGHFAAFTYPEEFLNLLVERVRPLAASSR